MFVLRYTVGVWCDSVGDIHMWKGAVPRHQLHGSAWSAA